MKKPENYDQVQFVNDMFDDLPDGAFFAIAEEHGVETEDFIAAQEYDEWLEQQKKLEHKINKLQD